MKKIEETVYVTQAVLTHGIRVFHGGGWVDDSDYFSRLPLDGDRPMAGLVGPEHWTTDPAVAQERYWIEIRKETEDVKRTVAEGLTTFEAGLVAPLAAWKAARTEQIERFVERAHRKTEEVAHWATRILVAIERARLAGMFQTTIEERQPRAQNWRMLTTRVDLFYWCFPSGECIGDRPPIWPEAEMLARKLWEATEETSGSIHAGVLPG